MPHYREQRQGLTKNCNVITGLYTASPPPTPHHHITTGPFIAVLLPSTSFLSRKKLQDLLKSKHTQFKGTEQASEPERTQVQEAQENTTQEDCKKQKNKNKTTPRHIILKPQKSPKRRSYITYRGIKIRSAPNISQNMQTKRVEYCV